MKKILIVEDDPAILKGLSDYLIDEHFDVITADDGESGLRKAKQENIDLIILDIMLPSKNGLEICKELREAGVSVPILILTSKKEELDKILGLEIGADDYVTKPFSIRELNARIKALLRRKAELTKDIETFSFGKVVIDFTTHELLNDKVPVDISTTELKILKYFIQHLGKVISRDQLLDDVWGYDNFPTTRTVDNFILSLRKKIETDPSNPIHLITIPKAGYKLVD